MEAKKNIEGNKKKRIWPIILIIGIVACLPAIVIIAILIIGAIFIKSATGGSNTNTNIYTNTYSYANTVATMNTINKPATVTTKTGSPYDYTIINDLITKDDVTVEAWINQYYPGSTIQKDKYDNNGNEWWTVTNVNPMNSIAVDGVVVNCDRIELHLKEGYASDISFIQSSGDLTKFNSLYNSFEALYGPQQPYIGKKDFFTRLTDPSYEYTSYSWFEGDFDGYYTLSLTRSVFNGQAAIKAQFNKY